MLQQIVISARRPVHLCYRLSTTYYYGHLRHLSNVSKGTVLQTDCKLHIQYLYISGGYVYSYFPSEDSQYTPSQHVITNTSKDVILNENNIRRVSSSVKYSDKCFSVFVLPQIKMQRTYTLETCVNKCSSTTSDYYKKYIQKNVNRWYENFDNKDVCLIRLTSNIKRSNWMYDEGQTFSLCYKQDQTRLSHEAYNDDQVVKSVIHSGGPNFSGWGASERQWSLVAPRGGMRGHFFWFEIF